MSVRADIAVTGASGQLGQLVVEALLRTQQPKSVRVIGRRAQSLAGYAEKGLQTAVADYADAAALKGALEGVDRLLLISSSEVGQRFVQHKNAIEAAKAAGVKLIVYTSILRADTSEIELAKEHAETETYIKASGIPFVFLRNGWYTENYTSAVQQGLSVGSVCWGQCGRTYLECDARRLCRRGRCGDCVAVTARWKDLRTRRRRELHDVAVRGRGGQGAWQECHVQQLAAEGVP
jgi:hypothetical protein